MEQWKLLYTQRVWKNIYRLSCEQLLSHEVGLERTLFFFYFLLLERTLYITAFLLGINMIVLK